MGQEKPRDMGKTVLQILNEREISSLLLYLLPTLGYTTDRDKEIRKSEVSTLIPKVRQR
jgi:hypothetical protein